MNRDERREFLKVSAAGVLGATSLGHWVARAADATADAEPDDLPPHREIVNPGLHAYGERSVIAGDTVHFRVSSTESYRLSIYRLGHDPANSSADEQLHCFAISPAAPPPIHPDSYVYVTREMVYWKRPQGGRVFHAGAIAAGWALSADARLATLMRNVLSHFDVEPRKT